MMADGCPTLMWVTNSEGDLQFINRAYREFCGKDLRRVDGNRWQLLVHHEDKPGYTEAFQQAVGEHKPFRAEARIRRADGEWRWVASYAEPRFSAGGGFLGHVGLSPDITERKLAEQALLKSEEKFRQLAENIREVFWMMDANGREILYVSPAYEEIWGRSCESLYQNPTDWLDAIHVDDRKRAHESFQKQLQGENIASEYRVWTLDGREKWIRDRAFPIRDQDGKLIRVAGIAEDITLRHLAEEAASKSAAQYERLVSNIPDVTWTCNRKGRTLYISPNCAKVFGWTPEQVCEDRGASWIRWIDPNDRDRVSAAFNALFETGVPYDEEFRFQRSDGQWVWARSRASSTYQENGNADHERVLCDGVMSEITEQKRIEEELRSKKAFLEAMTDSVAEGILVVGADGTKVLQNEKFKGMFRVPEHTLRDHDDKSLLEHAIGLIKNPEEALEKITCLHAHRDQISLDVIEMKDGTVIDRHSAPVIGAGGQYYGRIWTFRDITEKKRVEDRLVQLALAVEQSPASVVVTDLSGNISYVNRKFTECTGYSSAEVIGQSPRVLKSGHTSPKEYRELWEAITQGGEWCGEFKNRRKNGELYWESATIRPIRDKNGTISSFLALKEDITQKKHIEGQLRQAQKLEAVGQLAAGIAHEINTPAQYVANNTTFLKESWACIDKLLGASRALRNEAGHGAVSGDSLAQFDRVLEQSDLDFLRNEIPSAIDQSIEGLERVTKIVKAMKDFSHPGSDENVAIDINKAIETTIAVARNEWKYVADMTTEFDTNLPVVPCLRGEFNQAILNLIVNAAHAIAGVRSEGAAQKGEIAIRTRRHGESVEISIRDTGHGIPLEIRPRIFEPFFTTKEVGKGTGQGLSIAHNTILKRLHGQIWFESEVGLGTTFFIRLPLEPAIAAVQDDGAPQEVASYSSFSH
jgi:two-component system, NtrC family, sensor kinase